MSDIKTVAASSLCICVTLFLLALPCRVLADSPNQLSRQEEAEGFKLLFDGESMGQWNQVRILLEPAAGDADRLRCWLNDTQTVDFVVDRAPESEWSKLIDRHNREKRGTKYRQDWSNY